ncbi:MAG: ABC transporter permease subunit [Actinomycetota bacterium]
MLRNVFLKTLRDHRRSLIGWAIGLTAFTLFILAFYPTIRQSGGQFRELLRTLPPALRAISGRVADFTPEGYLNGQFFNLLAPLLLLIFAIGFGARTLAGEERDGTLELVMAAPVPRWRIVTDKFLAMAVGTIIIGLIMLIVLALGAPAFDLDVDMARLTGMVLSAVLLAVAFGALALATGALTGRRSVAASVAVVLAVTSYLINAFAPLSDSVDAFKGLSPFFYYNSADPLRNGADPLHLLFLAFLGLVFFGLALLAFDRRDVRV